jgi:hypothetical protein
VTCGFCGREFAEQEARKTCTQCSLFGGCKNVKCPYCGYEMPQVPKFLGKLLLRKEKRP